jgi:nucleotide-binding universal stress UspA family protein
MASESATDAPTLIAYDGSDFAKAAVSEAARQLTSGRSAIVLTVCDPPGEIPFLGIGGVSVDEATLRDVFADARAGAEKVAEEGAGLARDAGLQAEALVVAGAPAWKQIVETAEQCDASVIVVGSHGRSGITYALLGSVATAVAQHSKRSVLIVHRPG